MKIKQLIKILSQFDPDADVYTGEAHYNGADDVPTFDNVPVVLADTGGDCLIICERWGAELEAQQDWGILTPARKGQSLFTNVTEYGEA